jgi:acetoin utilization deacetylase AcuC-like enzyme
VIRVYSHHDCLQHLPGPGHPEAPFRLRAVWQALDELGLRYVDAPLAERTALLQAHDSALVDRVLGMHDGGCIDADTYMSPGSIAAARRACGAGLAALDAIIAGEIDQAFCAVRPPGHHATRHRSMGFCLFNAVAVCATQALAKGFQRVAIFDFDVHHGNGTQDIFAADTRVMYLSTHQSPLYPGTGFAEETGVGNIANAPLPAGCGSGEFQAACTGLLKQLASFDPDLLLISAGFDAHHLDPLAGMNLSATDYCWITTQLLAVTPSRKGVISMLEGGYSATALLECSKAHLQALMAYHSPTPLEGHNP